MLRADLGDFLYIIIGIVLLLAGGIEKYAKAKRQEQNGPRRPEPQNDREQRYDDFEDEDPEPPQTFEDLVKRVMQANSPQPQPEPAGYRDEAQSLETIPAKPAEKESRYHRPVQNNFAMSAEEKAVYAVEHDPEGIGGGVSSDDEYDFDLRNAVISAEILHRKY